MLFVAVRAARRAGDAILRAFETRDFEVEQKSDRDFVTSVDREAQRVIVREILRHYPDHLVVAEEDDRRRGKESSVVWYVDPLDGTTNFVHGYPHFAVSIAAWRFGRPLVGVIYDPVRNELFEARAGEGAFLNRRRLRASGLAELRRALFASGLPAYRREGAELFWRRTEACLRAADGYRRSGSAALDLAYVAAGRLDGYWEAGLMPWDIAAGVLLVQEAGGIVTDLEGAPVALERGDVLAAGPNLHRAFLEVLGAVEAS